MGKIYVAEVDDSIFVLDAGLKYPENDSSWGRCIPNMDYLFENKDRIAVSFWLTVMRMPSIALPIFLAS